MAIEISAQRSGDDSNSSDPVNRLRRLVAAAPECSPARPALPDKEPANGPSHSAPDPDAHARRSPGGDRAETDAWVEVDALWSTVDDLQGRMGRLSCALLGVLDNHAYRQVDLEEDLAEALAGVAREIHELTYALEAVVTQRKGGTPDDSRGPGDQDACRRDGD